MSDSALAKSPTGIAGLDQITGGGLPTGRPTLVCGSAGCGKTMLAMEFLVRGATEFDEPGVFMMFEESAAELTANVRSLGFDLDQLVAQKKLVLDHVHIERSEIEETGEYDLEGLFIRLGHAIDSIGAKRVVLDTVEALFAGLPNHAILRSELRRLFRWLKDRGMTAIITGEKGDGNAITRYGLEEYVADCVITLDQRVQEQVATRRLRILKYRGTAHGTNEYPFLIGEHGFSVLPITSLRLDHAASSERISTGIAKIDEMLGGKGVYRGSSILVSGSPGTGKSSIGAHFIDAACRRGERALLFAYEESAAQILRNMRSVGLDLERWVKAGLLQIRSSRPTLQGLEQHLVVMHDVVRELRAVGGGGRPDQQSVARPFGSDAEADADAAHRFSEAVADHRAVHQPNTRWRVRRTAGRCGNRRLVVDGHLAAAAQRRVQRRAQPHALRPEVARHEALQPGARVRRERHRHRPRRCLSRRRSGAHRHRARRAGCPGVRGAPNCASSSTNAELRLSEGKRRSLEAQIAVLRAQADAEAAEERFAAAEAALQDSIARQTTETIANLRGADGESTK